MQSIQTKIIGSKRIQVIHLDNKHAFPDSVKDVEIRVIGNKRIIAPAGQDWDEWFDAQGVSDDFMAERMQKDIFMKVDRFQTVIPESGTIKIPNDILKNFAGHLTEIMIKEVSKPKETSKIRSLRGKYHRVLSSTEEFCQRKAHEKKGSSLFQMDKSKESLSEMR